MSITAAIICAVVYAVINWLDPYTLSWQCLNRPIVVAPLVGLLLGDFQTGIIMGASLEAIFMGISAVGGSIPSDCLSGSIIAVAYTIVVGGDGAMETGLALSLTIGTVMSTINTMLMPLWAGLAPYWERLASECKPNKFRAISMVVNFIACLPGAAIIFLGVAFGIEGLQAGLAACPAWVHDRSGRCRYHDDRRRFRHPAVHDLVHRYRRVLLCRLYLRQEPGPEQPWHRCDRRCHRPDPVLH